jgi:hypothetical protein
MLLRASRAAWLLDQAERERTRALASARAEGVSIRALAIPAGLSPSRVYQIVAAADLDELDAALGELRAAGWPARKTPKAMTTRNWTAELSSSRVHQIVVAADLDALDAALGELRAAGWPAPEDPDGDDDPELDGRELIADRLSDEVCWLRQCADWLAHLDADSYASAVNLRPAADWPNRAVVAVDFARLRASSTALPPMWTSSLGLSGGPDLTTAVVLPEAHPTADR